MTLFGKCILILVISTTTAVADEKAKYDPCCSFPCGNRGICNNVGFTEEYTCDCYRTGFYGKNCENPTIGYTITKYWNKFSTALTKSTWFGKILNNVKFLDDIFMRSIALKFGDPEFPEAYNHFADYPTWDGYNNLSYYSRTLPPVPKNCPTPLGVVGPKVLPDATEVMEKVFLRDEFIQTGDNSNVLLPSFGQFLTHNVFKTDRTDPTKTWGKQQLNMDHLYGKDIAAQRSLRSFKGGKMKMHVINGEEFPPLRNHDTDLKHEKHEGGSKAIKHQELDFALANPFFTLFPTLLFWNTLYLREHNRLCDVLAKEHPDWDDERLYQTSRLIITAINLKITIEDYAQQIIEMEYQRRYAPELVHDDAVNWGAAKIHSEFLSIYHFHQAIPDVFTVNEQNYTLESMINNNKVLTNNGMKNFAESLSAMPSGSISGTRNLHKFFIEFWARRLEIHREFRTPSFNQFRKYIGREPLTKFEDITDNPKALKALKELYNNDIDGVEFFVGVLAEKPVPGMIFSDIMTLSIAKYAYRSFFQNIIGSPQFWRPSTFGGESGFAIAKTSRLKDVICRNIKGCPDISFKVNKNTNGNNKKNEL